ncbi:MAG: hydrogenase maturation protease [Anaerolineae bacterium]|nr:hydrogenase maturation protease [Anaerolineae bacterium]
MRCIGIGNLYRRDDGAGLYVAQRLRLEALPNLSVAEHDGEGTSLLDALSGADDVILIDALNSGAPPGTVVRFCVQDTPLPTGQFGRSTHAFGVAEAVELARSLGQLPQRCTVYGIEGACFEWGMGLTPAVEKAARRLADEIARQLREEQAAWLSSQLH